MELREGYKQTEIGFIPNDWDIATLEEVAVEKGLVRGPFGGALKKEYFVPTGYKVYEQRNAIYATTGIGQYYISEDKFSELRRFEVRSSDLIVSCSGTIGRIFRIPDNAPKGIINQALLKIKLNDSIDHDYFLHYFKSSSFQSAIIEGTQGGAMKNLVGMAEFKNTLLPLPPTKTEQSAIATALSDVDALITQLEKLITKKRQIKQGAMQTLLNPFDKNGELKGGWEQTNLDSLGVFLKGSGVRKDEANSGSLPCVRYGEIYTIHDEVVRDFYSFISPSVATTATNLKCNDILFAGSGETKEDIGKSVAFIGLEEAYAGGDIVIFRGDSYAPIFMGYYLNTSSIKRQKMSKGQGDAVVHISAKALGSIKVTIPTDIRVQEKIGKVLMDMDKEILALEAKLVKTKNLKQGMMQSLLTGQIRLVDATPKNEQ